MIMIDFSKSNSFDKNPTYNFLRLRRIEVQLLYMINSDGVVFLKDILKALDMPIKDYEDYGILKSDLSKSYETNVSLEFDEANPRMIKIYGE